MGKESWTMAVTLCDSCKTASTSLFSRADFTFLCIACDGKVHAANKLASRHARVWMCEVCEQALASVTCKADAAALCVTCDCDIHSANPLTRHHEHFPVVPFYDLATAVSKISGGGDNNDHHYLSDFDVNVCGTEAEEAEAASWLLPNPNLNKIADGSEDDNLKVTESESEYLFNDNCCCTKTLPMANDYPNGHRNLSHMPEACPSKSELFVHFVRRFEGDKPYSSSTSNPSLVRNSSKKLK